MFNQQPLISTDLIYSENIQENIGSQFEIIKAEEFSHILVLILINKSLGIQNFVKIYSIDLTSITLTRHSNNSNIVKQIALIDNIRNIFSYNYINFSSQSSKVLEIYKKVYNVKEDEYSDFSLLSLRRENLSNNIIMVTSSNVIKLY